MCKIYKKRVFNFFYTRYPLTGSLANSEDEQSGDPSGSALFVKLQYSGTEFRTYLEISIYEPLEYIINSPILIGEYESIRTQMSNKLVFC